MAKREGVRASLLLSRTLRGWFLDQLVVKASPLQEKLEPRRGFWGPTRTIPTTATRGDIGEDLDLQRFNRSSPVGASPGARNRGVREVVNNRPLVGINAPPRAKARERVSTIVRPSLRTSPRVAWTTPTGSLASKETVFTATRVAIGTVSTLSRLISAQSRKRKSISLERLATQPALKVAQVRLDASVRDEVEALTRIAVRRRSSSASTTT